MVKHIIRDCNVCQIQKPYLSAYHGLIQPLPIPDRIWKEISMDFIEKLPTSYRKSVILVVVDRLSKYAHFIPLTHSFTASQVAQVFLDQVYKLHWLLESITEVVNKSLGCYLMCMCGEKPKDYPLRTEGGLLRLPPRSPTRSVRSRHWVDARVVNEDGASNTSFYQSTIVLSKLQKKLEKWLTDWSCQVQVKYNQSSTFHNLRSAMAKTTVGVGDEEVVVGEGVVRFSSSFVRSTKSCFGAAAFSSSSLNLYQQHYPTDLTCTSSSKSLTNSSIPLDILVVDLSFRLILFVLVALAGKGYVVPTGRVIVPTGMYIVPTGRVIVAISRYVVPTGRVILPTGRYIVSTGRVTVATGRTSWCIKGGPSMKRTRKDNDGRVIIIPLTTAEEKIAVQRESKARTTLLQSNPDDHVADFHYMDDAKDIWNAFKARFGRNAESKKMRKSMLKQEFLEFRIGDAREFALMGVTSEVYNCPFGCDSKYNELKKRTKVGLGFTDCISENELGWDDSVFSVFTTNSEDVEGRPIFHSDKSSDVNTNDFASSDSSVKSSEHKPNDSTSCASTSSVSTSVNEAEIELNVGTTIKEPIIVQDLPSFTCNSSDKNENTSRTSCNKNGYVNKKAVVLLKTGKVNIPPARTQPVPTGKPKVFAPVPAGRQNRPFPVSTDRRYSPSVVLGKYIEKVYTGYPRTIVDLIHLHTNDNVVDLLTKALDGPRYVVPTGRVIVPTGRYIVPSGRVIVATD
nr:retrotransposon-related protein [Tanacetum cinerariifolium]